MTLMKYLFCLLMAYLLGRKNMQIAIIRFQIKNRKEKRIDQKTKCKIFKEPRLFVNGGEDGEWQIKMVAR